MTRIHREPPRRGAILAGCFVSALVVAFVLLAAMVLAFRADRDAARYPGATVVTSHSNYQGLPTQIRWDNSYFTTDNFTDVYNWYSLTFDLGAESRALERCIELDGPVRRLLTVQTVNVLICGRDEGQLVYVTRTTALALPGR
jgi:hypothetical protein